MKLRNKELKADYDRLIVVNNLRKHLVKSDKMLKPEGQKEYEKLKKEYYSLKKKLNENGIVIGDDQKW